ncbi:MAG: hypothetical protein WBA74_22290 [Cyclobacteriaceae bacterium]
MKYLLAIALLILTISVRAQTVIDFHRQNQICVAGADIVVRYSGSTADGNDYQMAIDNGTIRFLIADEGKGRESVFPVPALFSQRSGTVGIRLFDGHKMIGRSSFKIVADTSQVAAVESFCGPKHLAADRNDFSMIVSTALDQYGNPFDETQSISVKYQREDKVTTDELIMRPLFGFKRLYAPENTGHGTVVSMSANTAGKSYRLDYYIVDPEDFTVKTERQHAYADGEQVVKISTSPIQRAGGDLIANGTTVVFKLTDDTGTVSFFQGHTIRGVAQVVRYAPERATTWEVEALVPGYARSKQVEVVRFLPSVRDYQIIIDRNVIRIGPVKGYMGQWVKHGMLAKITVVVNNERTEVIKPLIKGMVILPFTEMNVTDKGDYELEVEIAGISKTLKFSKDD